MKLVLSLLIIIIITACASDEDNAPDFADTPDGARMFTSDIDTFWLAYDKAFACDSPEEQVCVFQRNYVDAASDQLRWMIGNKFCLYVPLSYFVERIAAAKPYYDAVRRTSENLKSDEMRERIMGALQRLEELYPEAVYPDMYFMIGDLSNGGTYTGYAVDLAIEAYLADENTPLSGVNADFVKFIQGPDSIPGLVVHEYVHVQQRYLPPDRDTLLAHSLIEGSANFIEYLVCERYDNDELQAYGDAHESELWAEFEKIMNGYDFGDWLYVESDVRPTNTGYYVGYKICEAYYAKASDKHQAVCDMMNLEDGADFLERSAYAEKFR